MRSGSPSVFAPSVRWCFFSKADVVSSMALVLTSGQACSIISSSGPCLLPTYRSGPGTQSLLVWSRSCYLMMFRCHSIFPKHGLLCWVRSTESGDSFRRFILVFLERSQWRSVSILPVCVFAPLSVSTCRLETCLISCGVSYLLGVGDTASGVGLARYQRHALPMWTVAAMDGQMWTPPSASCCLQIKQLTFSCMAEKTKWESVGTITAD